MAKDKRGGERMFPPPPPSQTSLQHHVERRGCHAPHAAKATLVQHVRQPLLACLGSECRTHLLAEPQLVNRSPHASGYADRPAYRPETKFERRGLKLGHGVWDLVFERRVAPLADRS